jgi:hypothetical protein
MSGAAVAVPGTGLKRQEPRSRRGERGSWKAAEDYSPTTTLVTFGSTWMPGPKVVETVALLM